MRTFLFRLLRFTLLLLLVTGGIDALLLKGLHMRRTHVFGVWNRTVHGEINADILFCGSSRAQKHFDARAIGALTSTRCYNIGMDGSQLDLQLPWLITYLAHNKAPRILVQEVDMISLMPDSALFFPSQYEPYLDEAPIYRAVSRIDHARWKDRWIPLYRYTRFGYPLAGLALQGLFGLEDTAHDPLRDGFARERKGWDGTFDHFRAGHPNGVSRRITQESEATLRTIIRTAQNKGSRVVLVYAPELDEMQRITLNREEVMAAFHAIAREMHVPFLDFSRVQLCAERRWFYNSQHLNSAGVDRFTPMIADSLRTMLARTP